MNKEREMWHMPREKQYACVSGGLSGVGDLFSMADHGCFQPTKDFLISQEVLFHLHSSLSLIHTHTCTDEEKSKSDASTKAEDGKVDKEKE